ncbi:MAG: homocysteine S-methyltransferase family protein [Lactococcus chungangensis]|uniref:Methionine synthase n=1 Tax=Pseudolactococcus chungangensis CAU 28 = DSM 22330 TaxID=1122154 RepID=A0A1K2H8Q4_9LACT|nr:homocysteine S-methyltransferase family protein [Lactococcus chungangensis]MDD3014889.1 homocysteine S-methyltransferase family protein [Lactococcus chungangensis]NCB81143.1 homocysteine methyltransferase [Bacilli bacterium]PCS03905.1 homocysteine methyltransferase [Lactococcus chungangensis CAU 28 = DSM 22330]SFZ72829.1 5-methyltetrahydrofolate--homocysteine methyltransferase [Lactococcus chungangensis CAU 28 = DSM 22330]
MTILTDLKTQILLFDGAMGTQLQDRGLPIGGIPEHFNLTHPEVVEAIHRDYVAAGADVITANTFQANTTKMAADELAETIRTAIALAKKSEPKYVAYDMGPTGQLLQPMGTLSFDAAYEMFASQAIIAEQAGADLVIIETVADLLEAKIAVLAVKENTKLPVFVTMTYQEDGRTFVGVDPQTATLTLQNLGVDVLGVNCSLGPKELAPIVATILDYAQIPVMVQANAGLPQMENGETVYKITPETYVAYTQKLLAQGVAVVGGCCGTTPEFIRQLRLLISQTERVYPEPKSGTFITSGLKTLEIGKGLSLIGERINPTGKPRLKEALRENNIGYIIQEAVAQRDAGADILDVNVGLPEIDEAKMMVKTIVELQALLDLPLQIDSSETAALEAGARHYNGIPLINSVNGKPSSMAKILPIVAKYGGVILGLCLDDAGIPETAEKRYQIAEKIVHEAGKYGITPDRVMIDPLVLTASAQQEQVPVTLDTIRLVKERLGCKTVVGLSNISFGLPNRALLNGTFLAQAFGAGLDAPIMNPLSDYMMRVVRSLKVFTGQDTNSEDYIANEQNATIAVTVANGSENQVSTDDTLDLKGMIIKGRKELTAAETRKMLETMTPLDIVNTYFIPALDIVGAQFEKGELFLPQLMQSAEATQQAQEVLKAVLAKSGQKSESLGRLLLATVEGDIHDIGKNIVKMILENYGYDVVDLGKDVPIETVVETVVTQKIKLVGLSALMTTTVQNMKKTITAVKAVAPDTVFMVGGAVLNEEYREFVGADYYAKDAMASVEITQNFFRQ